jgi:myo-inositol-1(or 4)-monophosphatase
VSDLLQIVESIIRQAGAVLMEGYGNVRHIQQKGVIDLVTDFDKRSEEVIISSIQGQFPDHAILAEESGHNETNFFGLNRIMETRLAFPGSCL